MPLVLEAISPFRLIDTDKIYKCILHISSHYIHKHYLFLASIAIYKTAKTNYTLRLLFYVRRQKQDTKECIMITFSSCTSFVSIRKLTIFGNVRIKEF